MNTLTLANGIDKLGFASGSNGCVSCSVLSKHPVAVRSNSLLTDAIEMEHDSSSIFASPFENGGTDYDSEDAGVQDSVVVAPAARSSNPNYLSKILQGPQMMGDIYTSGLAPSELIIGKMVGSGSYGRVFHGHHDLYGDVAVKLISLNGDSEKLLKNVKLESQAGMGMNHENVAQTFRVRVYRRQGSTLSGSQRIAKCSLCIDKDSIKTVDLASVAAPEDGAAEILSLDYLADSREAVEQTFRLLEAERQEDPKNLKFLLIQEFCNGGTLGDALERGDFQDTDKDAKLLRLKNIALNIAHGIQYMHENHIIHRDLSSNNAMLHYVYDAEDQTPRASNMTASLIDFGRVSINAPHMAKTEGMSTIAYASPEIMSDGYTSKASDIFSLGVLIWEVWAGELAWGDARPAQILYAICEGERLPIPEDMPAALAELLHRCWLLDPDERPTVDNIIEVLEGLICGGLKAEAK
ncbi:Serine/threonine/tyrosine-protein kinase HT1 [Picochlorum sp. SENEW3]|nr:Serine/threonine/tyrosine-protein kinase HT1 [Picochlorum sp. SENEW3]WPT17141.1 Serine/threonine/tyrosine-protein kinase HT1 [Picochlorum sp. SENEW3]